MKTYTNIKYAVLALSFMLFFAVGQVSAHMEPGDLSGFDRAITSDVKVSDNSGSTKSNPLDFNEGRTAGADAGKENVNSCYIGSNNPSSLDDDMNRGKSREFVAGFNSGFNDVASLYNYSYCKR